MKRTAEQNSERDEAFQHAVRQYFIRCAKDALSVCPLTEFVQALDIFQWYDDRPNPRSYRALQRVYKELKTRNFGGGAVGMFAYGLFHSMDIVFSRPDTMYSASTIYFALVFEKAGDSLGLFENAICQSVGDQARTEALRRHNEIREEVFGKFFAEYGEEAA